MKLLAATDFSKASVYMIEAIDRVVMATDAEVYLLHVVATPPNIPGPEFNPAVTDMELSERYREEQEHLDDLITQMIEAKINVKALLVHGEPVKAILSEARRLDADLIVVGSHGHGLLFDALVGSTSAGILRKSTIPVLVVPIPSD